LNQFFLNGFCLARLILGKRLRGVKEALGCVWAAKARSMGGRPSTRIESFSYTERAAGSVSI
ncbi:hypothetical protein, partial [Rouxiella badensis]|uniref:hypothetical protein n=1 Tax=Rouxiella badensis TaxID=1646377 RepID=UPI0028D7017D